MTDSNKSHPAITLQTRHILPATSSPVCTPADSLSNHAPIPDCRCRLIEKYNALQQNITTYENNIGFLSVSSKKGSSLIDEMNRKVQKLKDELNLVKEEIKAIDAQNSAEEE